jgi:hypothetical protein
MIMPKLRGIAAEDVEFGISNVVSPRHRIDVIKVGDFRVEYVEIEIREACLCNVTL